MTPQALIDDILNDVSDALSYYLERNTRPSGLTDQQYRAHVVAMVFGHHPLFRYVSEAKAAKEAA
jgi:hypothetical protein